MADCVRGRVTEGDVNERINQNDRDIRDSRLEKWIAIMLALLFVIPFIASN